MSFDRTTEAISHFIGHFDMALEELRLRSEYDEFKAAEAEAEKHKALEFESARIASPHKLKDYDPELKYQPAPNPPLVDNPYPDGPAPGAEPEPPLASFEAPTADTWIGPPIGGMIILPYVPIPSSVATVTLQINSLIDVDIVGPGTADFVSPYVYYVQLIEVASFAEEISGPGSEPLAAFEGVKSLYADKLADDMLNFDAPDHPDVTSKVVRGDDVEAAYVNGEVVEELPEIDDLLPQAIREKWGIGDEESEDGSEEPVAAYKLNPVLDKYETEKDDPFKSESGHRLVTGMNEATNTVHIKTSMIDAGVIIVGGDVKMLTSISQVNVASDHDIGAIFSGEATSAYNIAEIVYLAEDHVEEEDEPLPETQASDAEAALSGVDAEGSSSFSEGETQTTANAHGKAVSSEASASAPGQSAGTSNESFHKSAVAVAGQSNAAPGEPGIGSGQGPSEPDIDEPDLDDPEYHGLPKVWNLQVFEGDVVQLNAFTQLTFALDADQVDFAFHATSTYLSTGENFLFNSANAFEIGFGYDLIIVGGDMIDLTMVSQTNVLLDDDNTVIDAVVSVSGADNLLLNHVSVTKHGLDSFEEMQDNFETALDELEDGLEELDEDVAHDDLFFGIEGLRALYINGDLIKVTAVSQTNIIGDQDQVLAAMEDFEREADDVLEIVTGSNVLTNSTVIEDVGFDSVVMASGEVYDDALLYQAEFIDTDAAPTGVELTSLANEAVAFLAEDMLLPELDEDSFDGSTSPIGSDSADVMQTMTA